MSDEPMTMASIKEAVRELDPALTDEGDETYRIAVLLLAGLNVGTDYFALAAFTGEHVEWIAQIGERLRASGVWDEDGNTVCNWFDEDEGGVSFWLDVCVAKGFMERDA